MILLDSVTDFIDVTHNIWLSESVTREVFYWKRISHLTKQEFQHGWQYP